MSPFWLIVAGIASGIFFFALNHVGVIAGMVAPPPGYVPTFAMANWDTPMYLTWLELARTHWLLPDFHAPWKTEPAMIQPLFLVIARLSGVLGIPNLVGFYVAELTFTIAAAIAFLGAAQRFLHSKRQVIAAVLIAISSVPLHLILMTGTSVVNRQDLLNSYNLLDHSYMTADGFVRGGMSNSPTLAFGTFIMLSSFICLASYLEDGRKVWFVGLIACIFLGTFVHPFEPFIVVPTAVIVLLWRKRRLGIGNAILLCVALVAGLLPHLLQAARTPWVADLTSVLSWSASPADLVRSYGLPLLAAVWLLLLKPRLSDAADTVLVTWFLWTIVAATIPGFPSAMHGLDGFAYCIAILVVRRASTDKHLRRFGRSHRAAVIVSASVLLTVSMLALGNQYLHVWGEGRSAHPTLLFNAVLPAPEQQALIWLKLNTEPDDLVVSPPGLAPWVATTPIHSFASHDLSGLTYSVQRNLIDDFYAAGSNGQAHDEWMGRYGVRYVVVSQDFHSVGTLPQWNLRASFQSVFIYERQGVVSLKPYPGLKVLTGSVPHTFRRRVLDALGVLWR